MTNFLHLYRGWRGPTAYPQHGASPPKKANTPAILGFVGAVVVSAVAIVLALVLTNGGGGSGSAGSGNDSGGGTSGANDSAANNETPGGGGPSGPPADPTPVMQVVVDAINSENPESVNEIGCDDSATMRGYIDSLTQVHPTATVLGVQPVDDDTFRGMTGYSYTDPTDRVIEKILVMQLRENDDGEVCGLSLAEQE